jgi:membrane protease YdiL (CAAX protease family)
MKEAFAFDIRQVRLRDVLFVTFVGTALGVVFIAVFVAAWMFSQLSGHAAAPDAVERAILALSTSFGANMALIALFYIPGIWLMRRVAGRVSTRGFGGFFPPIGAKTLLMALAAGLAVAGIFFGLQAILSGAFGIEFHTSAAEKALQPSTPAQLAIFVAAGALIAPLGEEFFFRGYLLAWLRNAMAAPLAVAVSAAVFALVHGYFLLHPDAQGWIETGEVFIGGLAMGIAVLRTGSVWAGFALHAAYNTASVTIALFWPS